MYIDTSTGAGLDRALKKIDPLLCKMASKTFMSGYTFDDIKQELVIVAIDGIKAFNPDKKVKLSTFLHIHMRNKLISKIRSKNKLSNDASYIKDLRTSADNASSSVRSEINFSQILSFDSESGDEKSSSFIDTVSEDTSLYSDGKDKYAESNFMSSLRRLSVSIDPKTAKIIELVCLNDYSIKDAASEVGLSGWAASMRLKSLSKNGLIKDIFNKKRN
jgi:RNA polymerase sigma factor (sigma-70 family)